MLTAKKCPEEAFSGGSSDGTMIAAAVAVPRVEGRMDYSAYERMAWRRHFRTLRMHRTRHATRKGMEEEQMPKEEVWKLTSPEGMELEP